MTLRARLVTGRRPAVLRLASLALGTALALAGCTASHGQARPGQPASAAVRAAAPAARAGGCAAAVLRIRGGRQGDGPGSPGEIEFTNAGSRACVLRGLPRVAMVAADGKPLAVRLVRAADLVLSAAVLLPGQLNAAGLSVFWANWCGPAPGPLSVRVTLAGGVVAGPFNGPPGYNYVPPCTSPAAPSTIAVSRAFWTGPPG